jgi:glycosyltransferase involved in cell wall biosynthesis
MDKQLLYIYSGSRTEYKKSNRDLPDTQLFGLNHLRAFGLHADNKEFLDLCGSQFLNKVLSFRIRHALLYFLTPKYSLTFGASLIYQMPLKTLFNNKTRYILLNININQLLSKYRTNRLLYGILKKNILRMDGIVCLSQYQRRGLIEKHGIPEKMTTYIPLGVDINYHPYNPGSKREDFVLSVGRDKGRDYNTLIESARLIPDTNFIIVCSPYNLKKIVKKPGNVKVLYDISPLNLKKLYQKAKLMVLSTVGDDNIKGMDCSGQTVLLDSMANGLPVIATQKGYLKDYGTHNREIVITRTSDPVELSNAIVDLLDSPEKRIRLAESARARAEQEFTTYRMAGHLAAYFKKFL